MNEDKNPNDSLGEDIEAINIISLSKPKLDVIGHYKAREEIYPLLFKSIAKIDYVGDPDYYKIKILDSDTEQEKLRKKKDMLERKIKKEILDFRMAIDTIIKCRANFAGIVTLEECTVQERTVRNYRENICIRLLNDNGNPSEFFNFAARHYLFMVLGEGDTTLKRWIWVPHISKIIDMIKEGSIRYDIITSYSTFIVVPISEIKKNFPGTIEWESPPPTIH